MWWKVSCTQPPPFCSAEVTYPSMVATGVPCLGSGGVRVAYGLAGGIVSPNTVLSLTPLTVRALLSPQYWTTWVSAAESKAPNGEAKDSGWKPCAASSASAGAACGYGWAMSDRLVTGRLVLRG